MLVGLYMAPTDNFKIGSVHAHLAIFGGAVLIIYGLVYHAGLAKNDIWAAVLLWVSVTAPSHSRWANILRSPQMRMWRPASPHSSWWRQGCCSCSTWFAPDANRRSALTGWRTEHSPPKARGQRRNDT